MLTKSKLSLTNASIRDDAAVLSEIHLEHKNIAIYQRNFVAHQRQLQQLTNESLQCKTSGTVTEINEYFQSHFRDKLPNYNFLLEDISNLLKQFQQLTEVTTFRVLLATVSTNMCRKFHTDVNTLRMLCTYVGPGTLWLPDEVINQKAVHSKEENLGLEEHYIQQVGTGDVVILKGALYPGANAILHRSPSIEEYGEQRLLLRVDTNETKNLWG